MILLIVVIVAIAVIWAFAAIKLGDRPREMKKGDWPPGPGPGTGF